MKKAMGVASLLLAAGAASANITVEPLNTNGYWNLNGQYNPTQVRQDRIPDGSTYSAFSGLATSTGGLVLVEDDLAPVRDDVVTWDGASEAINDYINIPGTGALGQTRSVTESTTVGVTSSVLTVTISGSGDLAPSGLAIGTTALTRAAFGVGINLGATLGNDPLLWGPGATVPVTLGRINLLDATGASLTGGFITLPLATFFGNGNWNGIFGVVFNTAAGAGITTAVIEITTTKIPAPGAASLLALGGLVALRRRR